MRRPSKIGVVLGVAVRVVVMTVIFTLLAFAIGLLVGIGTTALYGVVRHIRPDMSMAYRFVAAPFAAFALVVSFFVMLTNEVRRARRPLEFTRPSPVRRTF